MTATFLNYINVIPPIERIYSRLGYAKGRTNLDRQSKEKIDRYIEQALQIIDLKASISRLPLLNIENNVVNLVSGISFQSKDLSVLFSGSDEVLFMGVTAGVEIAKTITEYSNGENVTVAVVYDALASEMTDAALDWVGKFFSNSLSRESKCLTKRRFSAGYGDFALKNQKTIFEVLEMEKLGISITEEFILIPEKTVTALAGIQIINEKEDSSE
ncbi:MAG: methionine synthase [Candidatus Omnitrophica bacterium]|nr:methionine synthase [Candidatus Omnitrophota bacterium]